MKTTTEDFGPLRTAAYYDRGSSTEADAARLTVCATAARLHPDAASGAAYDVLEALGLAPYREVQQ